MQCSKHQVPRLSCCEGQPYGLKITHLPHHNDVRIFSECGTQGSRKAIRVTVNLPLIDQTLFTLMKKFNWVLNRENVIESLLVNKIDHASECR